MTNAYVIGVDIGGTSIRIGASDGSDELIHLQKIPSASIFTGADSVENLIGFLKDYIRELPEGKKVSAAAIGFPSTINRERDTVMQSPNLAGLDNIPLKTMLEEELGIKVLIEKDVNLLYCHDRKVLNLSRKGVHIGIYFGTGIGNAIFIDGKPLTGKDGAAGEIGHIPLVPGGKLCGCGNRGCAECYAGGKYLVELINTKYPGELISELFVRHAESPEIQEFVENAARVVATETNLLNPETIVLGGGVLNMKGFPKDLLEEKIRSCSRKPYPEENLEIYYSKDEVENGVRGAVEYARERS